MDEIIKILDKNLTYKNLKLKEGMLYINVESNRDLVYCPYCGLGASKVHSRYIRTFQDLPIQGKKVIIVLKNRKMFCQNTECSHKTFSERFRFFNHKSKKTTRLIEAIIEMSLNSSANAASKTLKKNVVNVSRTTISNLLKKQ